MTSPDRSPYALGVTGYPLGHSLSPRLHAAALHDTGIPGEYQLYPVQPLPAGQADLEDLMTCLRDGRLDGLNVTIPHKQAVIPYMDALTPLAQQIGAVNTIFCRDARECKVHASSKGVLNPPDYGLIGDNTDAPGFMADLQKHFSPASTPQSALVLGAGGSARAVVYALLMAGWQVTIAARRPEKALEIQAGSSSLTTPLLGDRRCTVIGLESLPPVIRSWGSAPAGQGTGSKPLSLIVNTTPVGMLPDIDRSPWPNDLPFPDGVFVYDLVYNPMETALVRAARSAGLAAANGLGMLVEQAALGFERWTGVRPSVEAMRQAVIASDPL